MTELEPFSWTRSKFAKLREFLEIAISDILAEILIPRYRPNFGEMCFVGLGYEIVLNSAAYILDLKVPYLTKDPKTVLL